ncbi:MAG: Holliday junction resolvase RuvX [Notoacmeibacter sp.]
MALITIEELAKLVETGGTIAGLDLGTKTIGIAVSDNGLVLAHPRLLIRRTKFTNDASELVARFQAENVAAIVIGYPLNMDGSEGPRAQSVKAFVRNYEKFALTPFILWDERLSTVAVTRSMIELDMSRAKRAEKIDSAAAAFILQGVLDRLQQLR